MPRRRSNSICGKFGGSQLGFRERVAGGNHDRQAGPHVSEPLKGVLIPVIPGRPAACWIACSAASKLGFCLGVWSRDLVVRVGGEALWLCRPCPADEFVWCEAA